MNSVPPVRVMGARRSNAQLVLDLVHLRHLRPEWVTLDATYGAAGAWWKAWRPDVLVTNDLDPAVAADYHHNVTRLPWKRRRFHVVVFDGPYKLNGTSSGRGPSASDARYGVTVATRWQDRMALLVAGSVECARVASERVIVKCQDQVCSRAKRWQTRDIADAVERTGLWRLDDQLHVSGYRLQPTDRKCATCGGSGHYQPDPGQTSGARCGVCAGVGRLPIVQEHAHQDYSTALVFIPKRGR